MLTIFQGVPAFWAARSVCSSQASWVEPNIAREGLSARAPVSSAFPLVLMRMSR